MRKQQMALQGVDHWIRDLTVGGYRKRLQESVVGIPRIGYDVHVSCDRNYFCGFAFDDIELKSVVYRISRDDRDWPSGVPTATVAVVDTSVDVVNLASSVKVSVSFQTSFSRLSGEIKVFLH